MSLVHFPEKFECDFFTSYHFTDSSKTQKQLTPLLSESIANIFKNSTHPTKGGKNKNPAPSYASGTAWLFPFKIHKNSYGYRRNISTHNGNTLLDIQMI